MPDENADFASCRSVSVGCGIFQPPPMLSRGAAHVASPGAAAKDFGSDTARKILPTARTDQRRNDGIPPAVNMRPDPGETANFNTLYVPPAIP